LPGSTPVQLLTQDVTHHGYCLSVTNPNKDEHWDDQMHTRTQVVFPMSAHVLTQQRSLNTGIRSDDRSHFLHPWHIAMTVSVNAERHRVFQALTLPEYIETWIRVPGIRGDQQVTVTCAQETYRISCCGFDASEVCITGAYRVSRRSKMIFTWRNGTVPNTSPSLVTIRLVGDFARTTMRLSHSGLASKAEYLWHRALWENSMGRLCSLF
jgi:uncharacterized protein YndB with AHSA1/START domain